MDATSYYFAHEESGAFIEEHFDPVRRLLDTRCW